MEEKQGDALKERQPDSKVAAVVAGTDESMSMSFANGGEDVGAGNDEGPRTALPATSGAKLRANHVPAHGAGPVVGSRPWSKTVV